jgi:diaminopropionate ammonia-lyase
MPTYQSTPLYSLRALAQLLHVKDICVKDESKRFGLNAFKGLGVSYALSRIIEADPRDSYMFVTCTDGNHGKALAWRAQELGYQAIIFMPMGSEVRRVKAIEQQRASVIVTQMNYDDTVRHAAAYAKEHNAYFVQDTALPGYTRIPNDIVLGYSTMVREALDQMEEKPTHVFVQAGVGSLAGGVVWYLVHRYSDSLPFIGIIEAQDVACIYESVKQNKPVCIGGEPYTAMAGLNCGEANPSTFPLLKAKANCFIKCADDITFKGINRAQHPVGEDAAFSAGESGAVGLGFVEEVLANPVYKQQKKRLRLNEDSTILVFNTEGDMDDDPMKK